MVLADALLQSMIEISKVLTGSNNHNQLFIPSSWFNLKIHNKHIEKGRRKLPGDKTA